MVWSCGNVSNIEQFRTLSHASRVELFIDDANGNQPMSLIHTQQLDRIE